MTGLFITGTDTGVGKTIVACALAADLIRQGVRITVWKPAETGWGSSAEETSDAARLRRAAGSTDPLEVICPYRFREAVAPAVAARLEGVSIDVARLARIGRERQASSDLLIAEGAGGLLVPLEGRTTYADLVRDLAMSLLIVAPNRLGVINQTALTARVAASEGIRVIGFVLNNNESRTKDLDSSTATNRSEIADLTGLPCLGEIPYEPRAADAPERVATHLDVSGILGALKPAP